MTTRAPALFVGHGSPMNAIEDTPSARGWAEIDDISRELIRLQTALLDLAERKADDFFVRRGFVNTGDFVKQYGRLSGIVVHQGGATVVWQNGLARHKPPREVVTAIARLARI